MYNDIAITIVLSTLLFVLLIAGVIITMFFANKRNAKQEMSMTQMHLKYEKELRKVQFEVQEQVLVNIGRELHDNIGQLLSYMNLQLEQHKYMNPEVGPLITNIGGTLGDTIKEVRRIGKGLNTDMFETQGLIAAIENEVLRLRQMNRYNLLSDYDEEPLLEKDQKVIVFRILQETLNNILKHAGAKNIAITMKGGNNFRMEIKDDGAGFDYDEMIRNGNGAGLKNIMKRAELARLLCHVDTAKGKGTTFVLEQTT